jgi:hypothetical protein
MSHQHKRPVSRRDFLAAGAIPFAASLLMPDWLKLLAVPPSAMAATVCPAGGSGMIPCIEVDLAGGGALMANFVPRDQGGQPLPSYDKLGLGVSALTTNEFGGVPFASATSAGFLSGLRGTASAAAIANTAFVGVCVRSQDDSSNNPFSISGLLAKSGLIGSQLPNMGSDNSLSGGRHRSAVLASPAPLIVKSVNDIKNSVGYAAAVGSSLNAAQKGSLAKLVSGLNESQTRKLAAMTDGNDVKTLLDCAGIKNAGLVGGGGAGLDLVTGTGATVAGVWGVTAATAANNQNNVFGTMAYNAISGQGGSATMTLGGYDYHGNARATTNTQDANAGALVGRLLETAKLLGKPVFIYVTTDGSVSVSGAGGVTDNWAGDRGTAGMAYILFYSPAGRPATSGFQIGNYTTAQVVDDKTIVGGNPEVAAAAVFANYLAANKMAGSFGDIAGRIISITDLDKVLKIA